VLNGRLDLEIALKDDGTGRARRQIARAADILLGCV
jgi:hypothetical protein